MTVRMVWRARVPSRVGIVVMGSVGVTMLHPQGPGDSELPLVPEVAPSLSEVSSRVVCRDGIPLCTIPTNMALESPSMGERLRQPR
jgi:hypothetical protein